MRMVVVRAGASAPHRRSGRSQETNRARTCAKCSGWGGAAAQPIAVSAKPPADPAGRQCDQRHGEPRPDQRSPTGRDRDGVRARRRRWFLSIEARRNWNLFTTCPGAVDDLAGQGDDHPRLIARIGPSNRARRRAARRNPARSTGRPPRRAVTSGTQQVIGAHCLLQTASPAPPAHGPRPAVGSRYRPGPVGHAGPAAALRSELPVPALARWPRPRRRRRGRNVRSPVAAVRRACASSISRRNCSTQRAEGLPRECMGFGTRRRTRRRPSHPRPGSISPAGFGRRSESPPSAARARRIGRMTCRGRRRVCRRRRSAFSIFPRAGRPGPRGSDRRRRLHNQQTCFCPMQSGCGRSVVPGGWGSTVQVVVDQVRGSRSTRFRPSPGSIGGDEDFPSRIVGELFAQRPLARVVGAADG